MTIGINVALTLLYQYLKKKSIHSTLLFYLSSKKAFLRSQLPFLIIFFTKPTGEIDLKFGIDSRTCTRSF